MNLRDELMSRLPKTDLRMTAAEHHVDSLRTFPIADIKAQLLGKDTYDTMFHSFLAGWDAAMEVRFAELLDEKYRAARTNRGTGNREAEARVRPLTPEGDR